MSVQRKPLEDYVSNVVTMIKDLIEDVQRYSEFNRNVRISSEIFQRKLTACTQNFLENLDVIERVVEKPSGNVHEMVVDYASRLRECKDVFSYTLVGVNDMLKVIKREYFDCFGEYGVDLAEKEGKIYFPLVEKTLKDNIRKKRPDIFLMMNPEQKKLIESFEKD